MSYSTNVPQIGRGLMTFGIIMTILLIEVIFRVSGQFMSPLNLLLGMLRETRKKSNTKSADFRLFPRIYTCYINILARDFPKYNKIKLRLYIETRTRKTITERPVYRNILFLLLEDADLFSKYLLTNIILCLAVILITK
jgi:hypothetical protein